MMEFHRFQLSGGTGLSVLPTKKLKTVLVKVYFTRDLDDHVTRRTLIPMVLRRGTRSLTDMQAMQRHLENLYGASVGTGVTKVGEWHVLKFRMEALNGRFLPGRREVFGDSLRFLRELIFDPCLEEGLLRTAELDQEKTNLARTIESLIDQKDQYALERLVREMCPDEPFRRYEYGAVEDLDSIDSQGLTDEWRAWSRRSPCEIYVAGDLAVDATHELFAEVFDGTQARDYEPAPVPRLRRAAETRYFEERLTVNQGKLCLGFRNGTNYVRGDLEAQVLMNGVLGAFSHSKLFQNVREKASLAYDVHSFLEKTKGLLFVVAGIAFENYDKALAIIGDQVRALADGDIGDEEFESTRESLDNHLLMLEDNLSDVMEVDFVWRRHGRDFDVETYRDALKSVTKERIAAAAQELELDAVYFLRN